MAWGKRVPHGAEVWSSHRRQTVMHIFTQNSDPSIFFIQINFIKKSFLTS